MSEKCYVLCIRPKKERDAFNPHSLRGTGVPEQKCREKRPKWDATPDMLLFNENRQFSKRNTRQKLRKYFYFNLFCIITLVVVGHWHNALGLK